MKVLVTGGTGVIGAGVLPELVRRGWGVRLLSRGAEEEVLAWKGGIEAWPGDVTRAATLSGCAAGCEAVVHVTGIVEERPPAATFRSVNIEGTARLLAEAERAGSPRFVFISSLGADRGSSEYHQSKREAEALVRRYSGEWVILRPGNVYGPGDEVLSALLKMMRSLPAVPVIGSGEQRFQPIWFEDLGRAVAASVETADAHGRVFELAGREVVTVREVIRTMARVIGRSPPIVPVPARAAAASARVAAAAGVEFPLSVSTLTMLLEENRIPEGSANALTEWFGIEPMPIACGLERLARLLPDVAPAEGVGRLERKRFWADIEGSAASPEELIEIFRRWYRRILPFDFGVEGEADRPLEAGETISAAIPMRGHIQIRVEEVAPRRITFGTVEGHPLAGLVRFTAEPAGAAVRFMVEVDARAASWVDLLSMRAGGEAAQRYHWTETVTRMIERSGGRASRGVETSVDELEGGEAAAAEREAERVVSARRREENDRRVRERP